MTGCRPCPRCMATGWVVEGARAERCPEPDCVGGYLSSDRRERGFRDALRDTAERAAAAPKWEGSQ